MGVPPPIQWWIKVFHLIPVIRGRFKMFSSLGVFNEQGDMEQGAGRYGGHGQGRRHAIGPTLQ